MKLSLPTRETFEIKLEQAFGKPSGFDYMRIALALLIIVFHSLETSYGVASSETVYSTLWRGPVAALLPMFFALSGFLVAGSWERLQDLKTFLIFRVLRIVPALAVEVLLSALILGPLLTTVSFKDYLTSFEFRSYFLNILGDIHYNLPGLFNDNPVPKTVNAQLWTIPYELACYCALTLAILLGFYKRRFLLPVFIAAVYTVVCIATDYPIHLRFWSVNGEMLILSFLCGMIFYRFKEYIVWNTNFFLLSAFLGLILLSNPYSDLFAAIPVSYATIYLGLFNPARNKIILSGDYSYGLFLYGYTLQQAFASISPVVREWYWNILVVIPAATLIAVASWWTIEKPVLNLKKHFKK